METALTPSLQLLLEQAERERDAAQRLLSQSEEARDKARQQADQLQRYRDDHQARWGARPGRTGTVALMLCHHDFAQRLDQAVGQQQSQVIHCGQRVERAQALLQAKEMRVAAVRKLIERRLQVERSLADRRSQKQTDEAAQRAAWTLRHAAGFQ